MKCWVNGETVPVIMDGTVLRFKQNRVVRHLLTTASGGRRCDLNDIARMAGDGLFSADEMLEFYRLLGYSVDGFQDVFPDAVVKYDDGCRP